MRIAAEIRICYRPSKMRVFASKVISITSSRAQKTGHSCPKQGVEGGVFSPRTNAFESARWSEAIHARAVRMFYFSTNSVSGPEMGNALRRALPGMRQLFLKHSPPFTASINKSGDVALNDDS
jgi:hypothetical protein